MKKIKKVISLFLVVLLLLSTIALGLSASASSTDYKSWKQYDSRWGSRVVGNSSSTDGTMKSIGCAIVSVAMAAVHSGAVTSNEKEFNPEIFLNYLQRNGGLYKENGKNTCILYWNAISGMYSNFKYVGRQKFEEDGNLNEKAKSIKSKIDAGYVVVARVRPNSSHYVSIDYVEGNTIYMMDPASSSTVLSDRYTDVIDIRYYKGEHNGTLNHDKPQTGYYKTNASSLNLRSGPGLGYGIITTISNSTILYVTETSSNWGKVVYNGKTGWISLDYATKINDNYITMSEMTISESGLDFLKNQEGFRSKQYWDNSQYSIGYGSKTYNGEYPNGITREQADALLRNQVIKYENALRAFLMSYGITVSQAQFDALVSFTYNLGENVWKKTEWKINKMLRNGAENYSEAEIRSIFSCYAVETVTINGEKVERQSAGLLARRDREATLFISGLNQSKNEQTAPKIVSPISENGCFSANESVSFCWEPVYGAENYSVSIKRLDGEPASEYNANEKGINIGGYINYKTNETSVMVSASDFTAGAWYKFAVGAEFADGTSKWTFTYVKAIANKLSQIDIVSPNNYSIFSSEDNISFLFDRVNDADYYRYVLKELYSYPEIGNDLENGDVITDAKVFENDPVNFNTEWFKTGVWYKFAVGAYTNEGVSSPWDAVYFCVSDEYVETTGIEISRTSADIYEGNTLKLSATVYPYHATNTSVTWSSSDINTATVDSGGRITAIQAGKAVITAKTVDGFSASCNVRILSREADSYTVTYDASGGYVTPESERVESGDFVVLPEPTKEINITFDANGGKDAPLDLTSNVEFFGWKKNGTGTQRKAGAIYEPTSDCVMVASWDTSAKFVIPDETPTRTGYRFAHWKINGGNTSVFSPGDTVWLGESLQLQAVWETDDSIVNVRGVSLSDNAATIPVNGQKQLVASVTPSNATNKKIIWSSSDSSVATVSSSGLINAISAGNATIYVTTDDGNLSAYCDLTVSGGETKYLKFTNSEEKLILPNDENEVVPAKQVNVLTNINSSLSWSTDDESVIKIINTTSSYCMILPVSAGSAVLRVSCTSSGKTYYDECLVTVTGGTEKYFILSDTSISFDFSNSENGDPIPDVSVNLDTNVASNVSWAVSDTTVATISAQSTDFCLIHAVNPGTTLLTVSACENGETYSAECIINVTGSDIECGVYISEDYIELEASETGEPFGGEESSELIIRSIPADISISIYVENSSIATVGYAKYRGEDFYRASVSAISPGETNLVAKIEYNGTTYTAKCPIKVLSPSTYGVFVSESFIELEGSSSDSSFDGEESDEIIISSVPISNDISIYSENTSVANVGFMRKVGENFYRAKVTGIHSGETNLVAETVYGGITYTSKCKIKVNPPTVDPGYEEPAQTYTLSFDANGGWGEPDDVNGITSYVIKAHYPVRDGYTFLGWSTNKNAVSAIFTVGSTVTLSDNMTLYAIWKKQASDDPTVKTPVSCRIVSAPVKTSYKYKIDTEADLTGMIIEVTYSDGSKENITDISRFKTIGFDTKSTGSKVVTVECEGLTVQYNISVSYVWWQWIILILLFGFIWY